MHRLIVRCLAIILFLPQFTLASPSNLDKTYNALRVKHGTTISIQHGANIYEVYAARCNEIISHPIDSNYIILSPGDPIEIEDSKGNIMILYSLPCE
ncbi:MAG: hypothetical protein RJB24_528 [Candidatus Parcubacteria bacterium]|jgi:hypothetical protein